MKNQTPNFSSFLKRLLVPSLLIVSVIASTSHAEFSFTKIGDPAFEIVGYVMAAGSRRGISSWQYLDDSVFGASDQVFAGSGIMPIEPLDIPIGEHVRRQFAATGHINTDVFSVEEINWDNGWMGLISLSPSSSAPTGASLHNPEGPVIPNDIYPITRDWSLYQDGVNNHNPPAAPRSSLGSQGLQTLDDGTQIDFTDLNFSDYVLSSGFSSTHSLDSLVGRYERRATITDRNGDGWEYTEAYEVVRHPTDILGDLNYNGRFDVQDYNILQQNVEVAPAEPHGEFLRRLDLNGDSLVNADDTSHLASLFPTPEVTSLTVGETYSQDFDSLGADGAAGSELPNGWSVSDRFGTPVVQETNAAFPTSYRDLFSIKAPHALNVGQPEGEGMQDRSLAIYNPRDSSEPTSFQLLADTNTQADAMKIDFSVEAWDRLRSSAGNRDGGEAAFNVSVEIDSGDRTSDMSKIIGGEFTELVNLGTVTTGAELPKPDGDYLDGNDPAHRVAFASDVLHADIPAGSRLRFRWETTGEADASEEWLFGIDDVNITLAAAGDTDANGEVNFLDFLALAENFGEAGGWEQGDFSGDGQVDFLDFLSLAENFGQSAPAAAAAVPEPTAASIALFGLLGLIGFRKRR